MENETTTRIVDCEPTREVLFEHVKLGILDVEILLPAIKIADIVRQSQKQVIFSFPNETECIVMKDG